MSTEDEVSVKIVGESSSLKAAMQQGVASVREGVAEIRGSLAPMGSDEALADLRDMFKQARKEIEDYKATTEDAAGMSDVLAAAIGSLGVAGAVMFASEAFNALIGWVRGAWTEHEKLVASADRLHLKVGDVKRYSEGMLELAEHLQDAAHGLDTLSEAERRNFQSLGIDVSNYANAAEQAMQKIIASRGTDEEKIYAWAKLTSTSYEKAKKDLEAYERKLKEVVGWGASARRFGDTIGVRPNSGAPTASLGITNSNDNTNLVAEATASKLAYVRALLASSDEMWRQIEATERENAKATAERLRDEKEAIAATARASSSKLANVRVLMADSKRIWDEMSGNEEEAIRGRVALQRSGVDAQVRNLQTLSRFGQLTRQEELIGQRNIENERYQIDLKALDDRMALLDRESVAYARLYSDRELLEQQHQERLTQIETQAQLSRQSRYDELWSGIRGGMQSVLAAGLNMTLSVTNFFRSMAAAIAGAFANMAAKNIATMLTQAAAGKAIRLKEIAADARAAAAAAYKAVVGIPYVGPFLAPGAAAVAFGATMAFASAAKGYDIPAGVNPMTQLHEREMVLPAKHADVIRGMADQRESGSSRPIELKVRPVGDDDVLLRKRDLVAALRQLSGMNYRPV